VTFVSVILVQYQCVTDGEKTWHSLLLSTVFVACESIDSILLQMWLAIMTVNTQWTIKNVTLYFWL